MTSRFQFRAVRGLAAIACALSWACAPAQFPSVPINRPVTPEPGLGAGHGDEEDAPWGTREMQARQLKRLREEHQKEVMADSARLLQLATALKAETDKGVTATPGELKDVDEIAKLAKKVSEHIKNQ